MDVKPIFPIKLSITIDTMLNFDGDFDGTATYKQTLGIPNGDQWFTPLKLVLIFLCSIDPPGPPRKLQVQDLTKKTCVLTWKEPEDDGGSDILGYYVERIQGAHSTRWTPINRTAVTACKLDCKVSQRNTLLKI